MIERLQPEKPSNALTTKSLLVIRIRCLKRFEIGVVKADPIVGNYETVDSRFIDVAQCLLVLAHNTHVDLAGGDFASLLNRLD